MAKVVHSSPEETAHDDALLHQLAALLAGTDALTLNDSSGQAVALPQQVRAVLQQVVAQMERGQHVTMRGFPQELTPGQAADFLGIPRAQVLHLIHDGTLPTQGNGRHRIRLHDAIAYQGAKKKRIHEGINEIVRISEEMGLYDNPISSEEYVRRFHRDDPPDNGEQPE